MRQTHTRVQGAFYVVEKRVPIFSSDILEQMHRSGAYVSGGDGKIHAHIWIPLEHHNEIIESLEKDCFYIFSTL